MPRRTSGSAAGQSVVSNITINGNTIGTVQTNANLVLDANGTGNLVSDDIFTVTGGTASTSTSSGDLRISGGASIAKNLNVGGSINVGGTGINNTVISGSSTGTFTSLGTTGLLTVAEASDVITAKSAATGTVTHDFNEGRNWIHSSISGNFTVNFTNVPTTDNQEIILTLYLNQGNTGYYASACQIGGVAQTIKWAGYGTAPIPQANRLDVQTFTLIRRSGAWSVISSYSSYSQTLDGSSSTLAAPNALAIKAATSTTTNGLYWIKPPGAPSAQQVYCIMDNSIGDGGGWMLAFNILSTNNTSVPGGAADYNNTSFWESQGTFNNTSDLTTNQKTYVYGYYPVTKLNILLHNVSNTSFRGYGAYILNNYYTGQSLYTLCVAGGENKLATDNGRYYGSAVGASGCAINPNRPQTTYGDLFVDGQNSAANLRFKASGQWSSDGGTGNNKVRIATSKGDSNSSYGHTFAGIGGLHQHSGWKQDFAMAPISPYCDNPQSYGDRTDGVNATSYSGFSFPYSTSCTNFTAGPGQLNVGYAVFVK